MRWYGIHDVVPPCFCATVQMLSTDTVRHTKHCIVPVVVVWTFACLIWVILLSSRHPRNAGKILNLNESVANNGLPTFMGAVMQCGPFLPYSGISTYSKTSPVRSNHTGLGPHLFLERRSNPLDAEVRSVLIIARTPEERNARVSYTTFDEEDCR